MNDIFIGLRLESILWLKKIKKAVFWASLFGHNRKGIEPKIGPKIEEKRLKMSSRLLKNLKLMI